MEANALPLSQTANANGSACEEFEANEGGTFG